MNSVQTDIDISPLQLLLMVLPIVTFFAILTDYMFLL